ncbi:MAG: hypothetical protein K1X53_08285 [Candidatus Sumerlaeaceae bacterium]|nr:hypothetical protein [Candidatus Sumerlaeaceae bacterium]
MKRQLLTLLAIASIATPTHAVIFTGLTKTIDLATTVPAGASLTAGWAITPAGFARTHGFGTEYEIVQFAPEPIGDGNRLGSSFAGSIVIQGCHSPDTSADLRLGAPNIGPLTTDTLLCEYRLSEDGTSWTPWLEASPTTTAHTGCYPVPPGSLAFPVSSQFEGPPREQVAQILARHNLTLEPYEQPAGNYHFALNRLPKAVPRPPAGYLQVRLKATGRGTTLISSLHYEFSIVISGLKP